MLTENLALCLKAIIKNKQHRSSSLKHHAQGSRLINKQGTIQRQKDARETDLTCLLTDVPIDRGLKLTQPAEKTVRRTPNPSHRLLVEKPI
ncbi:hypothetical protein L596_024958 [Steinernema carpocapsae]|uniref:Uncharacterized protein n=1 Tax=Steinernema carpocapsae TaxID=34508 RepID=A0A4U5M6D5_STECR|nr:hypothetical protein L596_024958 [Steinernema carpocapsae]